MRTTKEALARRRVVNRQAAARHSAKKKAELVAKDRSIAKLQRANQLLCMKIGRLRTLLRHG